MIRRHTIAARRLLDVIVTLHQRHINFKWASTRNRDRISNTKSITNFILYQIFFGFSRFQNASLFPIINPELNTHRSCDNGVSLYDGRAPLVRGIRKHRQGRQHESGRRLCFHYDVNGDTVWARPRHSTTPRSESFWDKWSFLVLFCAETLIKARFFEWTLRAVWVLRLVALSNGATGFVFELIVFIVVFKMKVGGKMVCADLSIYFWKFYGVFV